MIDRLIKTAKIYFDVLAIYQIDEHKYLIVVKDKWELISNMAFFKMVGEVINYKIMLQEVLKLFVKYSQSEMLFMLYNEEEINYLSLRMYQKLY